MLEGQATSDGQSTGGGVIKVVGSTQVVKCRQGGTLTVRRIKRTVNLAARPGPEAGDEGERATAYAYNVFRACVIAADGVQDFDGQPVEFKSTRHARLGQVCSDDLLEAMVEADVLEVLRVATEHLSLSEAQAKN